MNFLRANSYTTHFYVSQTLIVLNLSDKSLKICMKKVRR